MIVKSSYDDILLAGNIMLKDLFPLIYIDFGEAWLRCAQCNDCNDSSEYQEPNCERCKEWHNGRIKDMRAAANLIYQLAMAPVSSESEIYEKEKAYIKDKVPPAPWIQFLFIHCIHCTYFILGEREMSYTG